MPRYFDRYEAFRADEEIKPIPGLKINLGLDLQGGSYLLLEINSDSLVKEKIQSCTMNSMPISQSVKIDSIS